MCNLEPFLFRIFFTIFVQEPKKVLYVTNNYSRDSKKVLEMVLKTHLEPFREPLKVPPVGQPKNLFFFKTGITRIFSCSYNPVNAIDAQFKLQTLMSNNVTLI